MKHFNRVAALLICLFIAAAPCMRCFYSYATVSSVWQPLNSDSELVEAFQYYCKSRDLTIDGSVANAVTQFTTGAFNGCCNTLGINITQLQAELMVDRSNAPEGVRFLFSSTGIDAYNRIFAQFLQDNNLSVGDSVDQNVMSGSWFTTADNVGCWLWTINFDNNSATSTTNYTKGSYYLYSTDYLVSNSTTSWQSLGAIHFTQNNTYTPNIKYTLNSGVYRYYCSFGNNTAYGNLIYNPRYYPNGSGGIIIAQINYPTSSYSGIYCCIGSITDSLSIDDTHKLNFSSGQKQNVNISIQSTQINNNVYEGDTIINNNGSTEQDTPSGGTPPGWNLGGGQGTVDDGNGNTWNITWPSFELPDLNIDWSINGLSEKFPFSIPFDLVSLVTVLSAEPEAPEFSGTIDLKVYQWNYDLDFSQFDTVAAVFRTAETILFVFGLIMITRKIIRG